MLRKPTKAIRQVKGNMTSKKTGQTIQTCQTSKSPKTTKIVK